ncbi:MAG: hypothetical protein QOH90_1750, partial [Actinomycetota bacterium]|nr:hypothetical protein [Actinomycetota bacterium]
MTDLAERARLAERAEAEFVLSMAQAAPEDARKELGMRDARISDGIVIAMEHDPTGGFWNRALGFGFDRPFERDVLHDVI